MAFADEVIKEQVVNILAVLSPDFTQTHLFENVLISGSNNDTLVQIPAEHQNKVLAYVLDFNELAYGIFYPDERSIAFFERNIGKTTSAMLQLTVIQQFFALMQDARYNPLDIGRLLQ